jgi:hypothetical protein
MDAIQLGITDSSIRFRAKTVGVVEKALGVDKEVTSATSAPGRKGVSCPPSRDKPCAPSSCRSEAGSLCGPTFAATGVTVAA